MAFPGNCVLLSFPSLNPTQQRKPAAEMPTFVPKTPSRRDAFVLPGLLILLGSMWGASFSLSKLAIQGGIPVLGYAAWQASASAVILLGVIAVRNESMPKGRRAWAFCGVAGVLGITMPNVMFYFVISHVPVGLMAVVVTTAPIMTYSLALALAMEQPSLFRTLGIGLGFVGALVIVVPKHSLPADVDLFWVLLAFVTPACYSMSNLFAARFRPPGLSSLSLASGMLIAAGIAQSCLMLAFIPPYVPLPPYGIPELALLGQILISSFAYIIYFHIVQAAGAVYLSQVGYVVTLTGILWGMLIFGEQHSAWLYAGTALVLGGFALVNRRRRVQPEGSTER